MRIEQASLIRGKLQEIVVSLIVLYGIDQLYQMFFTPQFKERKAQSQLYSAGIFAEILASEKRYMLLLSASPQPFRSVSPIVDSLIFESIQKDVDAGRIADV